MPSVDGRCLPIGWACTGALCAGEAHLDAMREMIDDNLWQQLVGKGGGEDGAVFADPVPWKETVWGTPSTEAVAAKAADIGAPCRIRLSTCGWHNFRMADREGGACRCAPSTS